MLLCRLFALKPVILQPYYVVSFITIALKRR